MKLKLSIYNTILMSIMVSLVLGFMIYISDGVIITSSQIQLKSTVEDNADEIEYDDRKLDLDDIDFYKNQVTTLIYSHDGYLIAGNINNIESFNEPLLHDNIAQIDVNGENFYIYDYLVQSRKNDDIFVRGIISTTAYSQTINKVFMIAFLTLPIFIILSGFGSYIICKKALKPLDKIIKTASDINSSDDLSLRIDLNSSKDEIYQLSQTFDEMFERLEQSFITEKQFTSDVSHELRTPITVILARCDIALKDKLSKNEIEESFEVINNQADKMKKIVNSLLSLIRLENKLEHLELLPIDLSELLEIISEEYQEILPENVELISNIEENITLNLDYAMMTRIISNLIDNSIKYIGGGDKIEINLNKQDNLILLEIKDNGIGISKENQDKIFNRFYQVESSRTATDDKSMGLGLSMVQQMTNLNKGKIDVKSELDKGSRFIITFTQE